MVAGSSRCSADFRARALRLVPEARPAKRQAATRSWRVSRVGWVAHDPRHVAARPAYRQPIQSIR